MPRASCTRAPRADRHQMTDGGVVHLESGVPPEVRPALLRRGHRIRRPSGSVRRLPGHPTRPVSGVYSGASESRKDGAAAGY